MLSMETLVDTSDSTRVIVVTEWESRKHIKFWLKSDLCKKVVSELDQVLDKPVWRDRRCCCFCFDDKERNIFNKSFIYYD